MSQMEPFLCRVTVWLGFEFSALPGNGLAFTIAPSSLSPNSNSALEPFAPEVMRCAR